MSDERIAALQYFLDLDNPYLGVEQLRIMEGIAALRSLESQNQALQELLKDCAYLLEHAAFSEGLGFSEIVRDVQRRIAERDPSPTQEN